MLQRPGICYKNHSDRYIRLDSLEECLKRSNKDWRETAAYVHDLDYSFYDPSKSEKCLKEG